MLARQQWSLDRWLLSITASTCDFPVWLVRPYDVTKGQRTSCSPWRLRHGRELRSTWSIVRGHDRSADGHGPKGARAPSPRPINITHSLVGRTSLGEDAVLRQAQDTVWQFTFVHIAQCHDKKVNIVKFFSRVLVLGNSMCIDVEYQSTAYLWLWSEQPRDTSTVHVILF